MTETKEDQQQITDMINRDLRGAIKHLKDTGCDGVTIATLENCFSHFKSQLSNREEEIEELKKQSNERYVFKEDGFDNYEFVDFLDFKKERAKHIKRFFKWENEVFQAITYGAERWVYYTFDGQDCHFFWNRQEALASLKSKGEA